MRNWETPIIISIFDWIEGPIYREGLGFYWVVVVVKRVRSSWNFSCWVFYVENRSSSISKYLSLDLKSLFPNKMNKTFFRERPFHVKGTHWKNKTVKEKNQKWYLSDYKNGNFDMLFMIKIYVYLSHQFGCVFWHCCSTLETCTLNGKYMH